MYMYWHSCMYRIISLLSLSLLLLLLLGCFIENSYSYLSIVTDLQTVQPQAGPDSATIGTETDFTESASTALNYILPIIGSFYICIVTLGIYFVLSLQSSASSSSSSPLEFSDLISFPSSIISRLSPTSPSSLKMSSASSVPSYRNESTLPAILQSSSKIAHSPLPSHIVHSFSSSELADIFRVVHAALEEDVGNGDVTSLATISLDSTSTARFLAKENGVISGIAVADIIFYCVDASLRVDWSIKDGDLVTKGQYFGSVTGNTHFLLIAERTVLNLMQRMSGIATATWKMNETIRSVKSNTRLLDTRKTVPGLRTLDKLAVRHGGGLNHRIGLYDMILVKDNHVSAAGGIKEVVKAVRAWLRTHNLQNTIPIEIEVRTLEELKDLLEVGRSEEPFVQRIMLDNMVKVSPQSGSNSPKTYDTSMIERALGIIRENEKQNSSHKYETEASGNVILESVSTIAATNVTFISAGCLTHSVIALDISLKIVESNRSS